jgi:5-hydroxyisourate hydrolase
MTLSTHVLDTAAGEPAAGVPVRLELEHDGGWLELAAGVTDDDGRLRDWVADDLWHAGTYRLVFDTAARSAFFPEVTVLFFVAEPDRHHHVPLLLSQYGYTTYRGS